MTNEDPIRLTGAQLDQEPPAAGRIEARQRPDTICTADALAGCGNQAERASSVPAPDQREATICETECAILRSELATAQAEITRLRAELTPIFSTGWAVLGKSGEPSGAAWEALVKYAYEDEKDGAREIQQITEHYNWLRDKLATTRHDADRWRKAHDGIIAEAVRMTEEAARATAEVAAERDKARSLLDEAREALKPFASRYLQATVPRDDYSYMRDRIADWFGAAHFERAVTVLTKIDAARKP